MKCNKLNPLSFLKQDLRMMPISSVKKYNMRLNSTFGGVEKYTLRSMGRKNTPISYNADIRIKLQPTTPTVYSLRYMSCKHSNQKGGYYAE